MEKISSQNYFFTKIVLIYILCAELSISNPKTNKSERSKVYN